MGIMETEEWEKYFKDKELLSTFGLCGSKIKLSYNFIELGMTLGP